MYRSFTVCNKIKATVEQATRVRESERLELCYLHKSYLASGFPEQCQETSAWKFLPSLRVCVCAIRGLVLHAADVTGLEAITPSRTIHAASSRPSALTFFTVHFKTITYRLRQTDPRSGQKRESRRAERRRRRVRT